MKLYTYWRSSTSYRVRIVLALKGIAAEQVAVNLVRDGGEQHLPAYRAINPLGGVPALVLDDGRVVTQSLAICEFLDDLQPEPALLPADAVGRARVRAFAQTISCEIHALTNLRVLRQISEGLEQGEDGKMDWYRRWTHMGLQALETMVQSHPATGAFVHGDQPTLADVCLVPQMYNARRFALDLTDYPTLCAIDARCRALDAFAQAAPEAQPDAPAGP